MLLLAMARSCTLRTELSFAQFSVRQIGRADGYSSTDLHARRMRAGSMVIGALLSAGPRVLPNRAASTTAVSALRSTAVPDCADASAVATAAIERGRTKTAPFQADMRKGWRNMALYWSVGALVGIRCGYLTKLAASFPSEISGILSELPGPSLPRAFLVALFVTMLSRWKLDRRDGSYGRALDWRSVVLFASANAIFETVLFFGSYDLGKFAALQVFGNARKWTAIAAGISTFFSYSGLIHPLFWLPRAFPQHAMHLEGEPFHTHALPYLTAISLVWVWLYESYAAMGAVCILHFLFNLRGGYTMRIPGPWSCESTAE